MRPPSMTVEQAEAALGARGLVTINSDNRATARKWLVAKGVPSGYANKLGNGKLDLAYNDLSDTALLDVMDDAVKDGYQSDDLDAEIEAADVAEAQRTNGFLDGAGANTLHTRTNGHAIADQGASEAEETIRRLKELLGAGGNAKLDADAVRKIMREELPSLIPVTRIEVKTGEKTNTIEGIHHPNFAKLVKLASARAADGYVPGIFLSGEASSGKTYACKNLAKALGLDWHFNGAISMPHEMLGFIDAGGTYHTTPFRQAYQFGGVYTFDEVDRSDPVALLAVNPHLANGVATFPDGQIKRHKDCVIVCTANTWGDGASAEYSGATKLDAAFRSRFPLRVQWDIDKPTEVAISGNEQWARRVQAARMRAQSAGLKVMIDTRITIAGAALIASGMTADEAAEATYLANLKPEQRKMVEGVS
jgi:hypothetical protein